MRLAKTAVGCFPTDFYWVCKQSIGQSLGGDTFFKIPTTLSPGPSPLHLCNSQTKVFLHVFLHRGGWGCLGYGVEGYGG